MMKKTSNHDVCSCFKSSISRTHKVLAASVVLAAGLLCGCSDSDVNEGEGTDPVEPKIETQAITVNNNPADHADRITLYGEDGARSRAEGDEEETDGQSLYKLKELALIAPPKAKGDKGGQNLSATCLYPNGSNIYVCYHLNEAYPDNEELAATNKHQGAVELIEYHENSTPVEIIRSQAVNDNQDFNHCTIFGNAMYTTGDTKAGAKLGRIRLNNGSFENADNMDVFKLKGGSGNCVVANGANEFLIATNAGFQSLNPNDLDGDWDKDWDKDWEKKLEFFRGTDGSAKHIATPDLNSNIVTLHLEEVTPLNDGTGEKKAKAVIQKGWGENAQTISNKEYEITPTNGKNTIAMDANGYIYVCLGENGVVKLDSNGKYVGEYCLTKDRPGYQGKACANGVAVDKDYVYIAYGGYGLVVTDKDMKRLDRYAHKEPMTENGEIVKDENGNMVVKAVYSANYVAVVDGKIYVAYGRNGLGILELEKKTVK